MMARCPRRIAARAVLAAALLAGSTMTSPARAQVTTDLIDFNLTETAVAYGNGNQYHISSTGDGWASYRWLDSPDKATVISGNSCTDYALLGSAASIGVGSTSYYSLFRGFTYQCFVVRGRTTSGSGSMVNHDGRIKR